MAKPNAFYLVYDDDKGSFVNIHKILTVEAHEDGSEIILKNGKSVFSPFKPRTILHKIRIIRHNLRLEADARRSGDKSKTAVSKE